MKKNPMKLITYLIYHYTSTYTRYMAPTPFETELTTTLLALPHKLYHFTMSNPNTNASIMRINQHSPSTSFNTSTNASASNLSGMKTVYVGKDQQPVTIMQMEHVTMPAWKKAASFDNLRNTVYTLVEAHSVADVMALVASELPIDTGAAFQEAQAAAKLVAKGALDIDYLTPSAFLSSNGKELRFSPDAVLADRPADITFFRFQCDLDGPATDGRIQTAGTLSFQFCLRFPQHIYHVNEGRVEELISSPRKPKGMNSMDKFMENIGTSAYGTPAKKLFQTELEDGAEAHGNGSDHDDGTSATGGVARTDPGVTLTTQLLSPKMKMLHGKDETEFRKGYFGPLTFFNTHADFFAIFGTNPNMLASNPLSAQTVGAKGSLRAYSERCKLDVYLNLCSQDYVGNALVDTALNAQEICRRLSELRQEYRDNGGRTKVDSPDELFNKYLQLSTSLSDNAHEWPLQLCSAFFSALTPDLAERMTTDAFRMPPLTLLTTKAKQLDALRFVRGYAAISFKALEDERDRMTKMLKQMQTRNGGAPRAQNYATHGIEQQRNDGQIYSYGPSQAESTLTRYNGGAPLPPPPPPSYIPVQEDVETKLNPNTGLQHPYDSTTNYMAKFPLGFRGCYACGGEDHRSSKDCPLTLSGQFDKQSFFREMWAHKPHTKNSKTRGQPVVGDHYSPSNGAMQHNPRSPGSVYATGQNPDNYTRPTGNEQTQGGNAPRGNFTRPTGNETSSTSNGNHYGPRNVNNDPAWMQNQTVPQAQVDQASKKARLMVYSAHIYSAAVRTTRLRHMPLDLDNGLPAIEFRFGNCIDDEICFLCHIDTCAAMNTGNLLVHQWIMTKHPYIVSSYEQFDDENPFDPLSLSCAVTMDEISATYGKLTAVVTYHTQYKDLEGNPITLSFGLGASVAVNAIVGLPTIRKWKACIDIGMDVVNCKLMNLIFPIHYHSADSGLPADTQFTNNDFCRPRPVTNTGSAYVMLNDDIALETAPLTKIMASSDAQDFPKDGFLQRKVVRFEN